MLSAARPAVSLLSSRSRSTLLTTPQKATLFSLWGILPNMNSPEKIVQDSLKKDFISVFSKSWCPYCTRAKNLLADVTLPPGKEVKVFELDKLDNGAEIQDYLATLTGQRSVPNIFVQGHHLGGSDDLVKASDSGELAKRMEIKAGL
ncbi:thioredoxin-like protein [Mrakia frigida]|uniref:glutaredoxin n=1 Tax=Mrakia frigida TaxID=29902 RepID=UPI003FCC26F5